MALAPTGMAPLVTALGGGAGAGGLAGAAGGLDPRIMALLGLGGGMLGAAGPSRLPVSFGQAAMQGLQGGLGGYAMANMANRQATQQAKYDDLIEQILKGQAGLLGRGMGGGSGGAGLVPGGALSGGGLY